jgi:uncharacterized FlaG/YvyC family protein
MERLSVSPLSPLSTERKTASRPVERAVADSAEGSKSAKPDEEVLRQTKVTELQRLANQAFSEDNVRLSISFEKSIGRFVYKGIDPETGEVVREYPAKEVIERIAAIREVVGVAFDAKL